LKRDACKLIVPEVVQTSVMDCGPAALVALLAGFGIAASYPRLREACHTDLDGTSLDDLELVAVALGLEAETVLVPFDHVLLSERVTSIAVMHMPGGSAHFVVIWRRHGRWVQVMDPSVGRRWLKAEELTRSLSPHLMSAKVDDFRAYAAGAPFRDGLGLRLERLGYGNEQARARIDTALGVAGYRAIGALDAAARLVESIAAARGIRRGQESVRLVDHYSALTLAEPEAAESLIPPIYWLVRPHPSGDASLVLVRGAAVLKASGLRPEAARTAPSAGAPPASAALDKLREGAFSPVRELLRFLRRDGKLGPLALLAGIVLAAVTAALEAVVFRAILYVARYLELFEQRISTMALAVFFTALVLVIEVQVASFALRVGRRLDTRLRLSTFEKLAVLHDRYFRTRLVSDMAERGHSAAALRNGPPMLARLTRSAAQISVTVLAMAWLDSKSLLPAAAVALVSIGLPMLANRVASERDLRVQTHAGALSRFYLDALVGQLAIRAHSAERAIRRVHEELLTEWARAGYALQRIAVAAEGLTSVFGFALVGWLLIDHVSRAGVGGDALLLAYWALGLPALGNEFAIGARQLPFLRNLAARALEPIVTPGEPRSAPTGPATERPRGMAVRFEGVRVELGGHAILEDVNLNFEPGSHVAIVGPSGAGKSSLFAALLGFQELSAGRVSCDGEALSPERLERLRRELTWLDPAITLWNRSLLDNVAYAVPSLSAEQVADLVEHADLHGVVERLSNGLLTPLGEGGGLVSGGEGQRVRLARSLARDQARLVLLDEPFRGLDRARRARLLAQVRRQFREATVLCVTHDLAEAAEFPRVILLEAGRVVEDGAPAELRARPTRYARMLALDATLHARLASKRNFRSVELRDGRIVSRDEEAP
jgi:ABC-type bacteriocin/lantibiotic exporter with double-glycine peptidase domain